MFELTNPVPKRIRIKLSHVYILEVAFYGLDRLIMMINNMIEYIEHKLSLTDPNTIKGKLSGIEYPHVELEILLRLVIKIILIKTNFILSIINRL
jgi:hypothetical protein